MATDGLVACSQTEAQTGDNLQQFELTDTDISALANLNEADLRSKIKDFLSKDTDMHSKILNYEPLEFDKIFAEVKQLGFKISNKILMKILDEFCITFTLKNIKSRANKAKSRKKYWSVPLSEIL